LCHRARAAEKVRGWKEATLAAALQAPPPVQETHVAANNPGQPEAFGKALRA
jgi:hypothetical protein